MLYNKDQIKKLIPYDEPFIWVDSVELMESDLIIAYKQTDKDEAFFKGHFTDFPIMPGALTVEGLAQTGTILLRHLMGPGNEKKHLLAYQIRSAQFLAPILPGDKITYRVQLLGFYQQKYANFLGEAFVGNDKKCESRFSVVIMDKEEMREKFLGEKKEGLLEKIFKLPSLKIGKTISRLPIIQGGMGVRVSLHNLAGAVAKEGGVGIISISGMRETSEVKEEIKKARVLAGQNGIIGVNIMGVAFSFVKLLTAALEEGVDLVIQGAGFRPETYDLCKQFNTPMVAMASSAKVAAKAESLGASAVVVEGMDAGGHLGFPPGHEMRKTIDILKEVVQAVKIPVIAAGGVFDGKDIVEMLRAGASGVQMATRFVATKECDAHENFKQIYVNAGKDDVVIIPSPVGLPGRAVKTALVERLLAGTQPGPDPKWCQNCMGPVCSKKYCILKALEDARNGDVENGLFFAGSNVWKIDKIVSVKELINELVGEANALLEKEPLLAKVTV